MDCQVCKRKNEVCTNQHQLSKDGSHWWSGWPGAYCLGCGADDPEELCLADNCLCYCHNNE